MFDVPIDCNVFSGPSIPVIAEYSSGLMKG